MIFLIPNRHVTQTPEDDNGWRDSTISELDRLSRLRYYPSDEMQSIYRLPEIETLDAKPNVVSDMLYNDDKCGCSLCN